LDSNIDFRQIHRLGSRSRDPLHCVVEFSGFEKADKIGVSDAGLRQLYRRCDESLEIVVRLFGEFNQEQDCEIETKIDNLMNVIYISASLLFSLCSSNSMEQTENYEIARSERFAENCSFGSSILVDANNESGYMSMNCAGDEVCIRVRTDHRLSETKERFFR
jgi:hypothetical protein